MTEDTKNTENPNLAIWNQVSQTEPQFTKSFSRAGGFRGTAIDAMYNIFRATELFGPLGIGWGYEILSEQILEGPALKDKNSGEVLGYEKIHEMKIHLWYRHNGEIGALTTSGATTLVTTNKYGVVMDEEAVKKSLTDAITKALSWLGFSADVHMGLYDDVKYVQGLKAQADNKGQKDQKQTEPQNTSQQSSEFPQIEGVKFKEVTGQDGNKYVVAKGDTYNKKAVLDKSGFKRVKGQDGKWVVYRPVQQAA